MPPFHSALLRIGTGMKGVGLDPHVTSQLLVDQVLLREFTSRKKNKIYPTADAQMFNSKERGQREENKMLPWSP